MTDEDLTPSEFEARNALASNKYLFFDDFQNFQPPSLKIVIKDDDGVRASLLVQKDCTKYHVLVNSEVTLFYPIFRKILRLNHIKSCEYCVKLNNKWLLYSCLGYMLLYLIVDIITKTYYPGWIKIFSSFFYFISTLILFLNLNYQIFMYQIYTFLVWWKFFDSIIMRTAMELINANNNNLEWKNKEDTLWQAYYICIINYICVCGLETIGISIIEGAIIVKAFKYFPNMLILLAIVYWIKWALSYCTNDAYDYNINLFNDEYQINMKHIVFLKAFDLALWFSVQFVRQIRFPRAVSWQKLKWSWRD